MEATAAAEVAFTPSRAPREPSSGEKALPHHQHPLWGTGRGGSAGHTPARGDRAEGLAGPDLPCRG